MTTTGHNRKADRRLLAGEPVERAGFTLVELLVVMAVVTILVGVIVPVTIQSRNKARSVACLSNLRQLGGALLAYGQDWDDRLPSLIGTPFAGSFPSDRWPGGSSATQLRACISDYVKSADVHRCGNDIGSPEYGFSALEGTVFSHAGSSYVPWSSARAGLYGIELNGARLSSRTPTSQCCLLRDYGSNWHGYRKRTGLDIEVTTVAHAAYADGHAAAVPVLSVTISDRGYVCYTSGRGDAVFVSGGSGDVRVELSGFRRQATEPSGQQRLQLCLSGNVGAAGVSHNVDRVFTFGAGTELDAAFRQVVAWADGLVAQ